MSAVKITKEMYHCKCDAKHKDGTICGYEWDVEELPMRCAGCKSRKWNRGYRLSRKPPLTFDGKTQFIDAWARELGMSKTAISWRIKEGWPLEQVLSKDDWRKQ